MTLNVFKEVPLRIPSKRLQALFMTLTTLEADPEDCASVNLVFISEGRIKALNGQYRSRLRSTDVLSFNIDGASDVEGVFGEIYIAVTVARRQAQQYGWPLSVEILRLTCHGLLHLFGYDHLKKSDTSRMQKRETELVGKILDLQVNHG